MSKSYKLTIDLVPLTAWFKSLFQYYQKNNQPHLQRKIKKELFKE
ncbi:MAG: hypothetical protein ACTSRH_16790 [Promethearchaeota archaeon]